MWCGPDAVAMITGWTRHDVWLHIRALREKRGKRLTVRPNGGTFLHETVDTLKRAGCELDGGRLPRPITYRAFCADMGKEGVWFLRRSRHVFVHGLGPTDESPRRMITHAYRIVKRPTTKRHAKEMRSPYL